MRGTTVRDIWKAGGNAVSGWLQTPDILAAETIASLGFDAVCVDLQHGTIDMQAAVGLFQAISTSNATPLARPTACEPAQIMKLLDAGAFGIICPMVNTGAESARLVAACHYAPRGNRSFGPVRAAVYAGSEYMAKANDTIFSLAMIETRQALDNIDDIVSVKGLTGLYLGLSDLSISLGYPPAQDSSHGEILEAVQLVLRKCAEHKLIPGIACPSGEVARKRMQEGFRLVTAGPQMAWLTNAARQALAAARG